MENKCEVEWKVREESRAAAKTSMEAMRGRLDWWDWGGSPPIFIKLTGKTMTFDINPTDTIESAVQYQGQDPGQEGYQYRTSIPSDEIRYYIYIDTPMRSR